MTKDQDYTELRCANCRKLLAQFTLKGEGVIRIQCKCKTMNTVRSVVTKPAQAALKLV